MSKEEIKSEINQVLEKLSADALEELLIFLKRLEQINPSNVNSERLQRIIAEDTELLRKLAQ